MEEEGHSPCTLKKKPKVGLDQGCVTIGEIKDKKSFTFPTEL